MNRTLGEWFEKLEHQRQDLLSGLAGFSAVQMRHRPAPSSWSILEVVDHLIKVENALVARARAQRPTATKTKFRDKVGAFLVISLMKTPRRVKVPAAASAVLPGSGLDMAEAIRRWVDTRDSMAALLESLQPDELRLGVFRHPVGGWMTMPQALAFVSAHIRHHEYQLERLKLAVGQVNENRARPAAP